MQFFKWISFISLLFSFLSCEFIDVKKVPYDQILKASEWSIEDQPPSFEECESFLNLNDQKKCFEESLLNLIHSGLMAIKIESPVSFESELTVVIKIDKNGMFDIDEIHDPEEILEKVINLKSQLTRVVKNLPKALPALKTNVGSYVNVKFILPIKIKAINQE